ncbi:hypothetical protein DL96DRAFT_1708560 [Flagelloscypha sp. PMI_526]|nr:hypothetical protein DL96DRAFT_1708560 [Flagelloscypha sp. PMI_526]
MTLQLGSHPGLPLELEREIFECAASAHGNAISLILVLVAHRVRVWIEPFLYTYVQFRRGSWHRIDSFIYTLHSRRPTLSNIEKEEPTFFSRHVKSLLMPSVFVSRTQSLALLQSCTGIENLALWARYTDAQTLAALIELPKLKMLSLLGCMVAPFLAAGGGQTLTHFDVSCYLPTPEECMKLPRVTHLAYTFDSEHWNTASAFTQAIEQILEVMPQLQVLLLIMEGPSPMLTHLATLEDQRVVIMQDVWWPGEWDLLGERGGRNLVIWNKAEDLIQARRATS